MRKSSLYERRPRRAVHYRPLIGRFYGTPAGQRSNYCQKAASGGGPPRAPPPSHKQTELSEPSGAVRDAARRRCHRPDDPGDPAAAAAAAAAATAAAVCSSTHRLPSRTLSLISGGASRVNFRVICFTRSQCALIAPSIDLF